MTLDMVSSAWEMFSSHGDLFEVGGGGLGGAFTAGIRSICWVVLKFLDWVLSGITGLVNQGYKVLTFVDGDAIASMLDSWNVSKGSTGQTALLISILTLVLIAVGIAIVIGFGNIKGSDLIKNALVGFAVIVAVPVVIGSLNRTIAASSPASNVSPGGNLYAPYFYDLRYMIAGKYSVDVDDPNTHYAPGTDIFEVEINEQVRGADFKRGTPLDQVFNTLKEPVYEKDGVVTEVDELDPSWPVAWAWEFLGRNYYRYHFDAFQILVVQVSNIAVICFTFFKVVRLAYEIIVNQLFIQILAVTDITSGAKLKEALKNLLSTYVILLYLPLGIQIFNIFQTWVNTSGTFTGLARVLIILVVALAVIDGPNLLERIFGIDAGVKSGFHTVMGMMHAVKAGEGLVKGVAKGAKLGAGIASRAGQKVSDALGSRSGGSGKKEALANQVSGNAPGGSGGDGNPGGGGNNGPGFSRVNKPNPSGSSGGGENAQDIPPVSPASAKGGNSGTDFATESGGQQEEKARTVGQEPGKVSAVVAPPPVNNAGFTRGGSETGDTSGSRTGNENDNISGQQDAANQAAEDLGGSAQAVNSDIASGNNFENGTVPSVSTISGVQSSGMVDQSGAEGTAQGQNSGEEISGSTDERNFEGVGNDAAAEAPVSPTAEPGETSDQHDLGNQAPKETGTANGVSTTAPNPGITTGEAIRPENPAVSSQGGLGKPNLETGKNGKSGPEDMKSDLTHASSEFGGGGVRPESGALNASTNPTVSVGMGQNISENDTLTHGSGEGGNAEKLSGNGEVNRQSGSGNEKHGVADQIKGGVASSGGPSGGFGTPLNMPTETGTGHDTGTPVSIGGTERTQISPNDPVTGGSVKSSVASNPVQRPQSQSVAPQVPDSLHERSGEQVTQNTSGGYSTGTPVQFPDRSQPPVIEPKVNTGNADLPYRREDGNVVYPAGNTTLPSREAGSGEKNSIHIVETENGYATVKEDGSLDPIFEKHPAGREVTSGSGQASSPQIAERSSGGRHKKVTPKDNPKHGRKRH